MTCARDEPTFCSRLALYMVSLRPTGQLYTVCLRFYLSAFVINNAPSREDKIRSIGVSRAT